MDFSAALLAGGRSSRMGRDKVSLEIDGRPLWRRQLQILRELGPSKIFVARPAFQNCKAFLRKAVPVSASDTDALQEYCTANDIELVADAGSDVGPLGGLVSTLRRCKNSHLLVLAVDLPNMSSQFLGQLLAMCSDHGGVVPNRNDRFEPLAAVYPARSLALAEICLNSGDYSLQQLARRAINAGLMRTRQIADPEESLFFNLNTPADLAALEKK
jgi:molybdenum cofactor guanylyltransferase